MLQIRKATLDDAQSIALLGRVTFNETFGHLFNDKNDLLEYLEKTFSVKKIARGLQKDENVFWIAFWDNLPVGYAKFKRNSPSEFIKEDNSCQLQKIYVLRDFLSKKVGLKLQDALLEEAKKSAFNIIWLSVLDSNERAIRFYKKNDFREIGTHIFQIGKEKFNFLAMAKQL